LCNVYKMHCGL